MTADDKQLSSLLTQLTDLLALPPDLDLPPLYSIECRRRDGEAGWTIRGHLWQGRDAQAWERLSAWALAAVARIELGEAYGAPGGRVRNASITVVVRDVSVEVWAAVSADFIPPDTCCVESYQLGDACTGCGGAGGPLAEIQAAFPNLSKHEAETRLHRAVATNGES